MKLIDKNERKKTALITGASSGIGYELSGLFAQDGYNLVMVAKNKQKLEQIADEFRKKFSISTKVISKDLSKAKSAEEIFNELQQESIQIDILVNNAGYNEYGFFSETDLVKELQMIQLQITSVTHLTKLFMKEMLEQGHGKILNVGSTGSFVAGPLNAVYCAAKAYILSFSEAIAEELQDSGVTITVLCPGATHTEFAERAQMINTRVHNIGVMDAEAVAKIGYRALMKGKRVVIAGSLNKLQIFSTRFTPRKTVVKVVKYMMSNK